MFIIIYFPIIYCLINFSGLYKITQTTKPMIYDRTKKTMKMEKKKAKEKSEDSEG